MASVGGNVERFKAYPYDLVAQVVGMNTLSPIKIVGSLIAAPLLGVGGEWSPHTNDGGGTKLNTVLKYSPFRYIPLPFFERSIPVDGNDKP